MKASRPVLHVVESLDRGAVETWLVRMLRYARAQEIDVDWTFYCALGRRGSLDDQAQSLGARVVYSPVPIARKVEFARALRAEIRRGKYDVLHCHHDLISAIYLLASLGMPIRRRIVHVHNADENILTPSRVKQLLYREPMRRVCLTLADGIVGISDHTLETFLAGRSRRSGQDTVLYYGVDPSPFQSARADRAAFRRELGLAEDARLVLFVGRLVPEKNPLFAVDVIAQMHRTDPLVAGIFVGSGSLDEAVRQRVATLGLDRAFRHLGWRNDIAEIMCCCDWFILTRPERPMEGFGIAVVEAQLAGLRLLISMGIAHDPLLSTAAYRRLALSAGPEVWAGEAMELVRGDPPSRARALDAHSHSPMAMNAALAALLSVYQ